MMHDGTHDPASEPGHDTTHERMITSMACVFDLMDAATVDAWDGLTGLQIQLLRVVATGMRVDRGSLALWTRTSRAALVPSLGALLQRDVLREDVDVDGPHLVVGHAGRQLLQTVLQVRAEWLRTVAVQADPPVEDAELRDAIGVLRRLASSV